MKAFIPNWKQPYNLIIITNGSRDGAKVGKVGHLSRARAFENIITQDEFAPNKKTHNTKNLN